MITEKLKFYADTPWGEKNKLFTWNVSLLHLKEALFRFFDKDFNIRAAWYETSNTETGSYKSDRINVQELFDEYCSLHLKAQRKFIKGHIKGHIKRSY